MIFFCYYHPMIKRLTRVSFKTSQGGGRSESLLSVEPQEHVSEGAKWYLKRASQCFATIDHSVVNADITISWDSIELEVEGSIQAVFFNKNEVPQRTSLNLTLPPSSLEGTQQHWSDRKFFQKHVTCPCCDSKLSGAGVFPRGTRVVLNYKFLSSYNAFCQWCATTQSFRVERNSTHDSRKCGKSDCSFSTPCVTILGTRFESLQWPWLWERFIVRVVFVQGDSARVDNITYLVNSLSCSRLWINASLLTIDFSPPIVWHSSLLISAAFCQHRNWNATHSPLFWFWDEKPCSWKGRNAFKSPKMLLCGIAPYPYYELSMQ